jgi:peroxiredoxin
MAMARFPRFALAIAALFVVVLLVPAAAARAQDDEAEEQYRQAFQQGIDLLTAKQFDRSVEAFKRCIELAPDLPDSYYNIACAYSLKGDADQAFVWLERAIDKGFEDVGHMARDKDLDPIRKDPRYQEMVAFARGEPRPAPAPTPKPEARPEPRTQPLATLKGEPATLERLKGKVVILDFWRTWCGPCKAEIPHFVELVREYGDRGLAVVGVSDEPAELQEKFADELKINYTLLIQRSDLPAPFDGIDAFPTTFILDKDGRVVHKFVGLRPKKVFEDAIRPLLGVDADPGAAGPTPKPSPAKPERRLF